LAIDSFTFLIPFIYQGFNIQTKRHFIRNLFWQTSTVYTQFCSVSLVIRQVNKVLGSAVT